MRTLSLRDPDLAWACLSRMVEAREAILNLEMEILPTHRRIRIRDHVHAVTFSDTMVLFTRSDEEDDLRSILILVTELYGRLLHFSVPFRGGLAHGTFRFNLDAEIFSGPALVNAYLLGEGAQWLGLVVDQTVSDSSRHLGIEATDGTPMIVEWSVPHRRHGRLCGILPPLKHVSSLVVNWPTVFRGNLTVNPPISVPAFYQAFQQLFGPYDRLGRNEQAKYRNTVAFVNTMLGA